MGKRSNSVVSLRSIHEYDTMKYYVRFVGPLSPRRTLELKCIQGIPQAPFIVRAVHLK